MYIHIKKEEQNNKENKFENIGIKNLKKLKKELEEEIEKQNKKMQELKEQLRCTNKNIMLVKQFEREQILLMKMKL
ncbi:MAG: hypothetical protein ACRCZ9_09415 [Fusobacteriaceae bacterium]